MTNSGGGREEAKRWLILRMEEAGQNIQAVNRLFTSWEKVTWTASARQKSGFQVWH